MADPLADFRPLMREMPVLEPGELEVSPLTMANVIRDILLATPVGVADTAQDSRAAAIEPVELIELDELGLDLTTDKVERICELIKRGLPRESAAKSVGLSPRQLSTWLRDANQEPSKHPLVESRRRAMAQVKQAIVEAEAELERKLSGVVVRSALVGKSVGSAQWILERRFPDKWGKQATVEHKGKVEHNHRHKLAETRLKPSDLSASDLAMIEQVLLRNQQAADPQAALRALPAPEATDAEFEVEP